MILVTAKKRSKERTILVRYAMQISLMILILKCFM